MREKSQVFPSRHFFTVCNPSKKNLTSPFFCTKKKKFSKMKRFNPLTSLFLVHLKKVFPLFPAPPPSLARPRSISWPTSNQYLPQSYQVRRSFEGHSSATFCLSQHVCVCKKQRGFLRVTLSFFLLVGKTFSQEAEERGKKLNY